MSDMNGEQVEITIEEALINRLAHKIGMLTAQLDMQSIHMEVMQQQLALAQAQLAELQPPSPVVPPPDSTVWNGDVDEQEPTLAGDGAQGSFVLSEGDQEGRR